MIRTELLDTHAFAIMEVCLAAWILTSVNTQGRKGSWNGTRNLETQAQNVTLSKAACAICMYCFELGRRE